MVEEVIRWVVDVMDILIWVKMILNIGDIRMFVRAVMRVGVVGVSAINIILVVIGVDLKTLCF